MALQPSRDMLALAAKAGYPKLPHFVDQMDAAARYAALSGAWASASAEMVGMTGQWVSGQTAGAVADAFITSYEDMLAKAGELLATDPLQLAVQFPVDIVLGMTTAAFIAADWGRAVHEPARAIAMVQSGVATEDELTQDFQMRISVFQAITDFAKSDAGKALRTYNGQYTSSGTTTAGAAISAGITGGSARAQNGLGYAALGIAPVVVAILAVAVIVLVAVLVYGAVLMYNNKRWNDRCDQGMAQHQAWALQACPQGDPNLKAIATAAAGAANSITATLVKYGLIGAAVVGTVAFLPQIVQSVKGAVQAVKRK